VLISEIKIILEINIKNIVNNIVKIFLVDANFIGFILKDGNM